MSTVAATSRLTVLMFTDIVDSTLLKSTLGPVEYLNRLLRHDVLFKEIVASYNGAEVVNDTGDGFFAKFLAVSDAVNAALRFQYQLSRPESKTQPLRTRVGMHLGHVARVEWHGGEETKVVGLAADLAARVMSLAAGGQILMTGDVFEAAKLFVTEHPDVGGDCNGGPENGASEDGQEGQSGDARKPLTLKWASYGKYKFKGTTWPVEIYEVGAEGIGVFAAPEDGLKARRWMEGDETGFWQRPFAQRVLPVLASLGVHVGIVAGALLSMEVIRDISVSGREQRIVAESGVMVEGMGDGGGLQNPGLGGDSRRSAAQDLIPDVPTDSVGIAKHLGTTLLPDELGGGGNNDGSALIGAGSLSLGTAGPMVGSGAGRETGVLAPFGVPGGQGVGIKTNFIGLAGYSSRVVFVCDATGSMKDAFDGLRRHLQKSIDGLSSGQAFNVILFQAGEAIPLEQRAMLAATAQNKQRVGRYLSDRELKYGSDPIPALERAFQLKPGLIYLLTDGDFFDAMDKTTNKEGNEAVVEYCRRKTADGKTKINAIAFVRKSEREGNAESLDYVKALQAIARNSRGQFKMVSEEEMAGRP